MSEPGTDLEYDLAHEAMDALAYGTPVDEEVRGNAVPNATPDYDGDYSYDLAHDVPRR
jgi:hypothetical protein